MLTSCTLNCPDACSLLVDQEPGGYRVMGNPDHPFTRGLTCSKINRYFQRLNSPERITSPMLKYRGTWQEISWDDALEICGEQLSPVCTGDPARMVHICDYGARGISKMVVERFFASLGCSRLKGSVCDETGIHASILDFGGLEHNPVQDLQNAQWIVNWGRDLSRSSIHTQRIVHQARKGLTRVISIWPGGSGYEHFSDQLIRVSPGRDRFLALAVLKILEDQGGLSPQAVAASRDWPALKTLLHRHSLEELAAACDVHQDDIYYLAGVYRQHPVSTLIGWGVQRHRYGGENVRCIDALSWLSGNVGAPGAGVFFNISSVRNFDCSWIPDRTGRFFSLPHLGRDLLKADDPPLSLAWINGTNPVNQVPESSAVAQALSSLDFVVVVDAFWTDTALCADLVLPCTLMGEEDDLLGSCIHDWINFARAVCTPPPGARSDLWIVQQLNRRLGRGLDIMDREECFLRSLAVPDPEGAMRQLKEAGYFLARDQQPAFMQGPAHADGLFHVISEFSPEPEPEPGYPFRLLSLIRGEAMNSQFLPQEQGMPPTVWVNPDAPGLAGVDLDREIHLVSTTGKLRVQVAFDPSLHPEALIYRRGDWMRLGGGVNQVIEAVLTDLEIGAAQYSQYVALHNPG